MMIVAGFLGLVLVFAGCATPHMILVNPSTGQTVDCTTTTWQDHRYGVDAAKAQLRELDCAKSYEAAGFQVRDLGLRWDPFRGFRAFGCGTADVPLVLGCGVNIRKGPRPGTASTPWS
jgi:hypothetical protein